MSDKGVSPVIGVILIVAITVIIAAVIAAFVFGISGNFDNTKGRVAGLVVDKYRGETNSGGYIDILTNGSVETIYAVNIIDYHHIKNGTLYIFKLSYITRVPAIEDFVEVDLT